MVRVGFALNSRDAFPMAFLTRLGQDRCMAVQKTRKVMKVLATISGGAAGVILPIWFIVADIRGDVRSAKHGTEAVAESDGVALEELQSLGKKMIERAEDYDAWREVVDQHDADTAKEIRDLKDRVTFLEGYLKGMSRGRFKPESRPKSDKVVRAGMGRRPPVQMALPAPRAPVGLDVGDAKRLKRERKKLDCSIDEPDCGAHVIEKRDR